MLVCINGKVASIAIPSKAFIENHTVSKVLVKNIGNCMFIHGFNVWEVILFNKQWQKAPILIFSTTTGLITFWTTTMNPRG
jgi:hypothetical protein